MKKKIPEPLAQTTCVQCKEPFQYVVRKQGHRKSVRYVCDECLADNVRQALKRQNDSRRLLRTEKTRDPSRKLGVREIAVATCSTARAIQAIERKALHRIRGNKELLELWRQWQEEGCPIPEDNRHPGEELLECQLGVADFYHSYEHLLGVGDKNAAKDVLDEIIQFQTKLGQQIGELTP